MELDLEELSVGDAVRRLLSHTKDSPKEIKHANNENYVLVSVCLAVLGTCAASFFFLRKFPAIRKRRPDLVLYAALFQSLAFFFLCLQICFSQDRRWHVYKRHIQVFPLIFWCVGFNTAASSFIIVYRTHHIWYDLGLAEAIEDMEWRLHIDEEARNKSFFIKWRDIVGNKKWTALYCVFWVAFLPAAGPISLASNDYVPSRATRMWIAIQALLPVFHFFLICASLPKYQDNFHFRTELWAVCLISIFYGSVHYGYAVLEQPHPMTVEYPFWLTFTVPFITARIMFQTTMVQYLNGLPITPYGSEMLHRTRMKGYLFDTMSVGASVLSRSGSVSIGAASSKEDTGGAASPTGTQVSRTGSPRGLVSQVSQRGLAGDMKAARPLLRLFADDAGLRLLMRHLTKEFSVENLLFIVETEQFINRMKEDVPFEVQNERMALKIDFAKTTPKSAIVLKQQNTLFECAVLLFDKYLRSNDQLTELNISYFIRQSSYATFGFSREGYAKAGVSDVGQVATDLKVAAQYMSERLSLLQLIHVFDEPRREAFNLVREGFSRMSQSPLYHDWAQRNPDDVVTFEHREERAISVASRSYSSAAPISP